MDLADANLRRAVILIAGLTVVNVVILSLSAFVGVEYMDSARFCGLTCHTVMAPEYTAYLVRLTAHRLHELPASAREPWVVKAKVDGVRQVIAVTFGTRCARSVPPCIPCVPPGATCEQCHWPQKFQGDKLKIISEVR